MPCFSVSLDWIRSSLHIRRQGTAFQKGLQRFWPISLCLVILKVEAYSRWSRSFTERARASRTSRSTMQMCWQLGLEGAPLFQRIAQAATHPIQGAGPPPQTSLRNGTLNWQCSFFPGSVQQTDNCAVLSVPKSSPAYDRTPLDPNTLMSMCLVDSKYDLGDIGYPQHAPKCQIVQLNQEA